MKRIYESGWLCLCDSDRSRSLWNGSMHPDGCVCVAIHRLDHYCHRRISTPCVHKSHIIKRMSRNTSQHDRRFLLPPNILCNFWSHSCLDTICWVSRVELAVVNFEIVTKVWPHSLCEISGYTTDAFLKDVSSGPTESVRSSEVVMLPCCGKASGSWFYKFRKRRVDLISEFRAKVLTEQVANGCEIRWSMQRADQMFVL